MKAVAHRDKDALAVSELLAFNPSVDLKYVRKWVRLHAEAMEIPEIVTDLERLIKKQIPATRIKMKSRKKPR